MTTKPRSTAMNILLIAAIMGGAFSIIGGFEAIQASALLANGGAVGALSIAISTPASQDTSASIYFLLIGVLTLVVGVFYVAFSVGIVRGSAGGWTAGIVAELLSVVLYAASILFCALAGDASSALTDNLVRIAFALGILIYLNTGSVRAYFGRA